MKIKISTLLPLVWFIILILFFAIVKYNFNPDKNSYSRVNLSGNIENIVIENRSLSPEMIKIRTSNYKTSDANKRTTLSLFYNEGKYKTEAQVAQKNSSFIVGKPKHNVKEMGEQAILRINFDKDSRIVPIILNGDTLFRNDENLNLEADKSNTDIIFMK